MKTRDQYALNSYRRVQDLLDEHAADVGALRDSAARKLLDESVALLETHANEQSSGDLAIAGQASVQASLEADLRKEHMQPIADFARARLRGAPDFAALTRGSSNLTGKPLVRAARAMATAAAPHTEEFTRHGFPSETITQLAAAADALSATIDGRANLRVRRAGSTEGVTVNKKHGSEAVKMLSAVINRQFAKDRTFLASWRSAKRVVAKPGVARGGAVAPISAPAVVATAAPVSSVPVSQQPAVEPEKHTA